MPGLVIHTPKIIENLKRTAYEKYLEGNELTLLRKYSDKTVTGT